MVYLLYSLERGAHKSSVGKEHSMKQFLTFNALVLRALLLLGLGPGALFANTIIVGLPADKGAGAGGCIPFGCDVPPYNDEFQQVYNASQFTGPMTITGLDFYNTTQANTATAIDSGTWTISLSTTTADSNTIGSNFVGNVGVHNTVVFSGNLAQPWTFPDTLTIALSTPFTYNPGVGQNLLMDVVSSGVTAGGGTILFDTNGTFLLNNFMSDVFGSTQGANAGVVSGYGLVTGFETAAQAVSEPSTFPPLGGLLVLVAGALRRKVAK